MRPQQILRDSNAQATFRGLEHKEKENICCLCSKNRGLRLERLRNRASGHSRLRDPNRVGQGHGSVGLARVTFGGHLEWHAHEHRTHPQPA